MKTLSLAMLAGVLFLQGQPGVKQSSLVATQTPQQVSSFFDCNPYAYNVVLESRTLLPDNNWEWVWSVQNPNPGNGNNGTAQDLSHWGMAVGACFDPSSLVEAGYSYNNITWASFNPTIQVDPSQSCMTTPVIKFDAGTTGTAKTYYRLVVSQFYPFGTASGYYKSGPRTGCCTFTFFGIGCGGVEERPVE
jgi:hypothetical protein